jgi:chemotaxis signal transduction protein
LTPKSSVLEVRAAELRRSFDESFAAAAETVTADVEDLLGLRVGGDAYAVRLGEITALLPERKIVALPSPIPELLGLAGLRGGIVPVYSLRALLGYGAGTERTAWIILAGAEPLVGLAFDQFEGHLRIARSQIAVRSDAASRAHVAETAQVEGALRGLIGVRSMVATIQERVARLGNIKES